MLGWNVKVAEVNRVEGEPLVAQWTAEPHFLSEIENLMARGDAFIVEYKGGYPNRYEVPSEILREWLEDATPHLHLMFGGRSDLYKLNVNYEKLDQVPDGVYLSVEIWDQS